jgi:hypothetical protein
MSRYYVKNPEGKWNIFSSIIDDLLYDEWIEFENLVDSVCAELVEKQTQNMKSLLTDNPRLNVMSYEECMNSIVKEEEIEDEQ